MTNTNNIPQSEKELLEAFNKAKVKTTEKENATLSNVNKFTALQATNCAYMNIPEKETVALIQSLFNVLELNIEIQNIVKRAYNKVRLKTNNAFPKISQQVSVERQEVQQFKVKESVVISYSLESIIKAFRHVYMERLPDFNYNDLILKKTIVFYDALDKEGAEGDLYDKSLDLGLNQTHCIEVINILQRLKILEIKDSRYQKRTARVRYN